MFTTKKYLGDPVKHEGRLWGRQFNAQEPQYYFLKKQRIKEQVLRHEVLPLPVDNLLAIGILLNGVSPRLNVAEPRFEEQPERSVKRPVFQSVT